MFSSICSAQIHMDDSRGMVVAGLLINTVNGLHTTNQENFSSLGPNTVSQVMIGTGAVLAVAGRFVSDKPLFLGAGYSQSYFLDQVNGKTPSFNKYKTEIGVTVLPRFHFTYELGYAEVNYTLQGGEEIQSNFLRTGSAIVYDFIDGEGFIARINGWVAGNSYINSSSDAIEVSHEDYKELTQPNAYFTELGMSVSPGYQKGNFKILVEVNLDLLTAGILPDTVYNKTTFATGGGFKLLYDIR